MDNKDVANEGIRISSLDLREVKNTPNGLKKGKTIAPHRLVHLRGVEGDPSTKPFLQLSIYYDAEEGSYYEFTYPYTDYKIYFRCLNGDLERIADESISDMLCDNQE